MECSYHAQTGLRHFMATFPFLIARNHSKRKFKLPTLFIFSTDHRVNIILHNTAFTITCAWDDRSIFFLIRYDNSIIKWFQLKIQGKRFMLHVANEIISIAIKEINLGNLSSNDETLLYYYDAIFCIISLFLS